MMTRRTHRETRDRGFTLVELIAMLALIAALSIAAAPAMTVMQRSRERAAIVEMARLITLAQRRALTTGESTGVRLDTRAGAVTLLRLEPGETEPTPLAGPTGETRGELLLSVAFAGVTIESISGAAGGAAISETWFDPSGAACARDGADLTPLARDVRLELTGGGVILVRAITGAVQW